MKSMELFLILVLAAAGNHAVFPVDETTCNLTKNTCPCTPLLEGTVYIQVMTNASGREVKCLKVLPSGTITVFSLKKGRITTNEEFSNRLQFIINNGTLKITDVRRNDSGQYSIEVFNSDGVQEENLHFTLDVKDNGRVEAVFPVDETTCNLTKNTCPCTPLLEGTVYIQVMTNASGREVKCLKVLPSGTITVFSLKKGRITTNEEFSNRLQFIINNGTLKITDVRRNDSGQYSIEVFNSDGVQEENLHFTLDVKDNGRVEAVFPVDETTCNLTKNTCPCTPLLEGTVYIQVMTNASGREVKCLKVLPSGTITVFSLKKGRITTNEEFSNRLQFIINNGTLKITDVRRNDSGQYSIEVFNSDGVQEENLHFTLDVKDNGRVEAVFPVDETTCNLTKNTCPCTPLLEGTVYIQVMTNASGREVKCLKVLPSGTITVFSLKKGRITTNEEFSNRLQFIINNGTLKITDVRRNDSGQYSIEVFNSDGVQEENLHFTLDVKDNGRVEAVFPVDETTCNLTKNTCPCTPLLEGTVYIQVMTNASGREVKCLKVLPSGTITVFSLKKGRITTNEEFSNRLQFIINNGTLKITDVRRNDSGQYSIEVFNSDGVQEENLHFTLDVKDNGRVEASVSSVLLLSECLSQGEMRVSCSSEEGDSPQYSWTLDGRTLTDAELLSGNNESNIITLRQHISGHLVCSVRNHVSNVSKEQRISTCGMSWLIFGLKAVVVLVSLSGICIYSSWKKKKLEEAAVPQTMQSTENSVLMTEMSSYCNT